MGYHKIIGVLESAPLSRDGKIVAIDVLCVMYSIVSPLFKLCIYSYAVLLGILSGFSIVHIHSGTVGYIKCDSPNLASVEINMNAINTYCWIHSNYRLPLPKDYINHSGIVLNNQIPRLMQKYEDEVHTNYYFWVPYIITLHMIICWTPYFIWYRYENGRIKSYLKFLMRHLNLNERRDLKISEEMPSKMKLIGESILNYAKHGFNFQYALMYFIFEILNTLQSIGLLFAYHYFFRGVFLEFGFRVFDLFSLNPDERFDFLNIAFPKVIRCIFRKFGYSKSIETLDFLCLLPVNIFNEKAFLILWFAHLILLFFSTLGIFYRIFLMMSPRLRKFVIRQSVLQKDYSNLDIATSNTSYSDWFLLNLISYNFKEIYFGELLKSIVELKRTTYATTEEPQDGNLYKENIKLSLELPDIEMGAEGDGDVSISSNLQT